jgi:probable phosphoglycerate mutase
MSAMDRTFLTNTPGTGELILVRHGQQDFPAPGTKEIAAYLDPPLSKIGVRQAEAVGAYLAGCGAAAVYSSRLLRAAATGAAIAEHHGLSVSFDDRLREVELFRDLPPGSKGTVEVYGVERMRQAQEDFTTTRKWSAYPGSEGGDALRARVCEAVESFLVAHPASTVVVACHGGVINAYITSLLSIEEDFFFRPAHSSVHRVLFSGTRRVVQTLNEFPHLEGELLTW